jgi:hypothetical protein
MEVSPDIIDFSEQLIFGLLLSRIAIYSQKNPSNFYYGVGASGLWIHLAISDYNLNNTASNSLIHQSHRLGGWLIPAGLWLITHVWLTLQRFHRAYWKRSRPKYNRVATSVAV